MVNYKIKKAFTLVELLVVIAIIGILSGLIIVGMSSSTQSATIAKAQIFSSSLRDSLLANLVSEWTFSGSGVTDGGNATTAYTQDSWNSNNCTIGGTPLVYSGSNCVYGPCLKFNGTTDYLDCANGSNINFGSGSFAVGFWSKQTSYNFLPGIVWHGSPESQSGFYIRFAGADSVQFLVRDGSGYTNMTKNIGTGSNWNYVLAQLKNGSLELYSNGVDLGGHLTVTSPNLTTTQDLFMGRDPLAMRYYNGYLDDVRIYNTAMNSFQVKDQYFSGLLNLYTDGKINKEEYERRIGEIINHISLR